MSQNTTGRAWLVESILPSAKTITNATNASPIVITTSTPHGVTTNEIITVSGVTGNTAANGTWVAGTVTSNTIVLLAYPGRTNSTGSGAYVSGGTMQSLWFGRQVPVPVDLTDAMRAGGVNVPFEANLDMAAFLMYRCGPASSIYVQRAGDTMTGSLHMAQGTSIVADGTGATIAGPWSITGNVSFTNAGSVQFNGPTAVESGSTLTIASGGAETCAAGSKLEILGRCVPRSARVPIADGNKRIGVAAGTSINYSGKRFTTVAIPAAPRTITLDSTNAPPDEGETLEVIWRATTFGGGTQFTFQREDTTAIALFVGSTAAEVTVMYCWAEFEFVSGVWRLGATNGFAVDSTNALFGVVPAAGA